MEELAEPESRNEELVMRCRKNVRKLIVEYNAAADKTTTALYKFRQAIVALKSAPSQLAPPHTQANRYDDYVYVHQQSMAGHPHPIPDRTPVTAVRRRSTTWRRGCVRRPRRARSAHRCSGGRSGPECPAICS
jgi:hypothetical protein